MQPATKSEHIFLSLRNDILEGKLLGGARININELAQRYNTSPMPIRKAIERLEESGYVRTIPHTGTWVCKFDFDLYFSTMLLRSDAEALATRIVALQHNDSLVSELNSILDDMRNSQKCADHQRYGILNHNFHETIYEACGNTTLIEHIRRLVNTTQISANLFSWLPLIMKDSFREHELLTNAIIAGDGNTSAALVTRQRCRSNLSLLHYMKNTPIESIPVDMLRKALQQKEAASKIDFYIALFEAIQSTCPDPFHACK